MSDDNALETSELSQADTVESQARHFATEKILKPHEAFAKFVGSLTPLDASDFETIGIIQEAARRYNEVAEPARQVSTFYHFTDDSGAQGMREQGLLGREGGNVYVTSITPEQAKPLFTAEAGKAYEIYFRDKKMPATLQERLKVTLLGLRFNWEHSVVRRVKDGLGQRTIPVGAHKLENVAIVATELNNPLLRKDPQGETFVPRPLKLNGDPDFKVFGPLSTKPPITTGR